MSQYKMSKFTENILNARPTSASAADNYNFLKPNQNYNNQNPKSNYHSHQQPHHNQNHKKKNSHNQTYHNQLMGKKRNNSNQNINNNNLGIGVVGNNAMEKSNSNSTTSATGHVPKKVANENKEPAKENKSDDGDLINNNGSHIGVISLTKSTSNALLQMLPSSPMAPSINSKSIYSIDFLHTVRGQIGPSKLDSISRDDQGSPLETAMSHYNKSPHMATRARSQRPAVLSTNQANQNTMGNNNNNYSNGGGGYGQRYLGNKHSRTVPNRTGYTSISPPLSVMSSGSSSHSNSTGGSGGSRQSQSNQNYHNNHANNKHNHRYSNQPQSYGGQVSGGSIYSMYFNNGNYMNHSPPFPYVQTFHSPTYNPNKYHNNNGSGNFRHRPGYTKKSWTSNNRSKKVVVNSSSATNSSGSVGSPSCIGFNVNQNYLNDFSNELSNHLNNNLPPNIPNINVSHANDTPAATNKLKAHSNEFSISSRVIVRSRTTSSQSQSNEQLTERDSKLVRNNPIAIDEPLQSTPPPTVTSVSASASSATSILSSASAAVATTTMTMMTVANTPIYLPKLVTPNRSTNASPSPMQSLSPMSLSSSISNMDDFTKCLNASVMSLNNSVVASATNVGITTEQNSSFTSSSSSSAVAVTASARNARDNCSGLTSTVMGNYSTHQQQQKPHQQSPPPLPSNAILNENIFMPINYSNTQQSMVLFDKPYYQNYHFNEINKEIRMSHGRSLAQPQSQAQTQSHFSFNGYGTRRPHTNSEVRSPTPLSRPNKSIPRDITLCAMIYTPPDHFLKRAHLIESKDPPPNLCDGSRWDRLSKEVWNRFARSQQSENTYKKKMYLWRYLYTNIRNKGHRVFSKYSLYLVGSTISGFGLDTSDVDMCLVSRSNNHMDPRSEALMHLSLLKEHLECTSEILSQYNLIQAKVPILRFYDTLHHLEIDLNFNNSVGIRNTHLLHCYSQMDWRLRPLVIVVKLWAQFHYINNAKDMTISSYSLVLMVIHFLQYAVQPCILPCLHSMYPDKFQDPFYHRVNDITSIDMCEELEPFESQNKQTLGELFVEFLGYYSNFSYDKYAISVRTAGVLPIEECRIVRTAKNEAHAWGNLCIEEPFDLTNTARSCYDEKIFECIKTVFNTSWNVVRNKLDLNLLFERPFLPPPTQIVFDNYGSNTAQLYAPQVAINTT